MKLIAIYKARVSPPKMFLYHDIHDQTRPSSWNKSVVKILHIANDYDLIEQELRFGKQIRHWAI